jgi:hypothetical protein
MHPEKRKERLLKYLNNLNISNRYIDQNRYFKKYIDNKLPLNKAVKQIKNIYEKKERKNQIRHFVHENVNKEYRHFVCNDIDYKKFINTNHITITDFGNIIAKKLKN